MEKNQISERRALVFGDPWLLDWCAAQIPGTDALGWHNQKAQATTYVFEKGGAI